MSKNSALIFFSLVSAMGGFLFGFDTAVISGTISFVRDQFVLTPLWEGWFVGSALVGCIAGVSFTGFLADYLGRKPTLILSALLFFISALGCMIAGNLTTLIMYRLIGGIGVGIASLSSPLYISEISRPEIRGRLVTLYQLAITIGILSAYFTNAYLLNLSDVNTGTTGLFNNFLSTEIWRSMFGTEIFPALIFLILLFFIPRSPRWLLAQKREQEARSVLANISESSTIDKEVKDIKEILSKEKGSLKDLLQPGMRTALLIGILLAVLSQFSGINAIIYYGPRIFEEAGLNIGNALNGQVIIGIVNVLFTLIAIWKIDSLGRRFLLLSGCSLMLLMHTTIGFLFFTENASGILLLIFITLFIAAFAFSYGPVVWTLIAEMYPTRIRGRAMSVATLALWIGNYIIGQVVPWMLEVLKPSGTFWIFAVTFIPAILIIKFMVPETKGKSLEDIERFWMAEAGTK